MMITLELSPQAAAALKRFAEKVNLDRAESVLYPHVKKEIRSDQVRAILEGFCELDRALGKADVRSWPWIESGHVSDQPT